MLRLTQGSFSAFLTRHTALCSADNILLLQPLHLFIPRKKCMTMSVPKAVWRTKDA